MIVELLKDLHYNRFGTELTQAEQEKLLGVMGQLYKMSCHQPGEVTWEEWNALIIKLHLACKTTKLRDYVKNRASYAIGYDGTSDMFSMLRLQGYFNKLNNTKHMAFVHPFEVEYFYKGKRQ